MPVLFPIQNKESLHHAYILESDVHHAISSLENFLADQFEFSFQHPDVFLHQTTAFGVDDAELVIQKNSRKPSAGIHKIIVISLSGISHQAQNSLLKTLEEPAVGTHIFIIAPTASIFLPTVRSRVHVLNLRGTDSNASGSESLEARFADEFIASSHPGRLEITKSILSEKEKEKISDSDIVAFVRAVEKRAHASMEQKKLGPKAREDALRAFVRASEYLYDTSSSKKLLLEYIALILPIFK